MARENGHALGGAATVDDAFGERNPVATFGLEERTDRAVGQIVAVEVIPGVASGCEELIRRRVVREIGVGVVCILRRRAVTTAWQPAVTRGIGERFDPAHDEAIDVGGRALAAEGGGVRGGRFDLALIHAVEVAIEIPGRAADDAGGPVVGVRGRIAAAAEQPDVRPRKGVVLELGAFIAGGRQADEIGPEAIRVEEVGSERDFVGEAKAFGRFGAVAILDQVDGRADRGDRAEVAGGPLGGARCGQQQFLCGADLIDEVRAIVIEVRRHARVEGRIRRAVKEGLTAVSDRRSRGGVLLPRIHLQGAEDRVGQFEGGREVCLHAAVERVREDGEGQRGDLVPEQAGGRGHRVAGGETAALAGGPGVEVTAGARLRELEEIPVAGGQDVVGAPGLVVRAEASGQQGGRGGVEGGGDGLDGAALRGGTGEAFVPIGHGGGGEGGVGVG